MKKPQATSGETRTRRKYDEEFKKRALQMLRDGHSGASVARQLGVSVGCSAKWKQGPGWSEDDAEVERLRRRLKEVEMERDILKSGHDLLSAELKVRYQAISQESSKYPVTLLCRAFEVSRSGYYAWKSRVPETSSDPLATAVRDEFGDHSKRSGSRRIQTGLRRKGIRIGRRRIRRIYGEGETRAIQPTRFVPRTTNSQHGRRMSPNLLVDLKVTRPRQVLVSDITYVPLQKGRLAYLATFQDVYTRRVLDGI